MSEIVFRSLMLVLHLLHSVCVCVCRLVSSYIKEQGEECQKSFGHDGATRHAAIHFESATHWEIQLSL